MKVFIVELKSYLFEKLSLKYNIPKCEGMIGSITLRMIQQRILVMIMVELQGMRIRTAALLQMTYVEVSPHAVYKEYRG